MNDRTFSVAGAHKLDDPERLAWMPPADAIAALGIKPGDTIADIGAGTGVFTLPFARAVAPSGKVWAVDMQPEMLAIIRGKRAADAAITGVELVQGTAHATSLPGGSILLAFLANVWHELDPQEQVLVEAKRILRPGGRIAILDWSPLAKPPPGPPTDHRIDSGKVSEMLGQQGYMNVEIHSFGMYHYLVIAQRP